MPDTYKTHFNDFGSYVLYAGTGELAREFPADVDGRAAADAFCREGNAPIVDLTPVEAAYLASGENPTDLDPRYAALKRADPQFQHMAPASDDEWEFDPE